MGFDKRGNPPIDGWAEVERGGETVIFLLREDETDAVAVTYDPDSQTVHVSGDAKERFDVSHVRDVGERRFEWAADGRLLELSFRR